MGTTKKQVTRTITEERTVYQCDRAGCESETPHAIDALPYHWYGIYRHGTDLREWSSIFCSAECLAQWATDQYVAVCTARDETGDVAS